MSDEKNPLLSTKRLSPEELISGAKDPVRPAGPPAAFALWIYSRDGLRVVPLREGEQAVVGRSQPSDVAVRDSSMSRQHAVMCVEDGLVWAEDLGSTNGTTLDGDRIDRATVTPGAKLRFGTVAATVLPGDQPGDRDVGFEPHDSFRRALHAEIVRAKLFGRKVALVMLGGVGRSAEAIGRWSHAARACLRPFDRIAMYSADTLEVLMPEVTFAQAKEALEPVLAGSSPPRCGIAAYPDHGSSSEELIEACNGALLRARSGSSVEAPSAQPFRDLSGEEPHDSRKPIVKSPAMERIFKTVDRLASSIIPVLILGETGTGKEVVAREIHTRGARAKRPMICINCGGIPEHLVEGTLFGHERGAFTGADKQSKGIFESAHGGTVFLDEVGELPQAAQAALLRVLETGKLTRVGSSSEIEVDVRILAATNQNLEGMCKEGGFREDLLYRLNAMTITIPPLKERTEELGALIARFMRQANDANGCDAKGVEPEAMELMEAYPWPGNVRELRNAVSRAVVIADGETITVDDLPDRIKAVRGSTLVPEPPPEDESLDAKVVNLKAEVARYEATVLEKALEETGWDRTATAKNLGIPVRTLSHKIQTHGLKREN